VNVAGVCRDVRLFLRGLAQDLPEVFPRPAPRVHRPVCRRVRPPKPPAADLARARAVIAARVAYWAGELGLKYNRVSVKNQGTLWGSCSRRGNLNFSWRLAAAPPEALDYVVIHELCHLREMNHSKKFWAHVGAVCPDYKARRCWLRDNTVALMSASSLN
jgi:hypothetical protein